MKKILFIGIGNEISSQQRITNALITAGVQYLYSKWTDLSFLGDKLFIKANEVNLDEIGGVYFNIPRFSVTTKFTSGKKIEVDFHLENEMHALLTVLKEKNIYAPNMEFFLKYPYYNKFAQSHIFESNNVPTILTVHLNDNKQQKILDIFSKVGMDFPVVAKESYGSRGSKVWKIENALELKKFIAERRTTSVVFQPFNENNADYRVIIVNGQCQGIMKRSAKKGEWKNNFSLGGEVEKHEDQAMKKFAINACKDMNLDIAVLDIFATPEGYLVIEANLFFGLDGFELVFDEAKVSEKIVKMIIDKMKQ